MKNCEMGRHIIEKQKKNGKPRVLFVKDHIPEDKQSSKYKLMIDFLNEFNISLENYENNLRSPSITSINSSNSNILNNTNEQ